MRACYLFHQLCLPGFVRSILRRTVHQYRIMTCLQRSGEINIILGWGFIISMEARNLYLMRCQPALCQLWTNIDQPGGWHFCVCFLILTFYNILHRAVGISVYTNEVLCMHSSIAIHMYLCISHLYKIPSHIFLKYFAMLERRWFFHIFWISCEYVEISVHNIPLL